MRAIVVFLETNPKKDVVALSDTTSVIQKVALISPPDKTPQHCSHTPVPLDPALEELDPHSPPPTTAIEIHQLHLQQFHDAHAKVNRRCPQQGIIMQRSAGQKLYIAG